MSGRFIPELTALEGREQPVAAFAAAATDGVYVQAGLFDTTGRVGTSAWQAIENVPRIFGLSTASADFNEDTVPDIVLGIRRAPGPPPPVAPGATQPPDESTEFITYSGAMLNRIGLLALPLHQNTPYPDYFGDLSMAATDLGGDGHQDLVVAPDGPGAARIRVFPIAGEISVTDFFAFDPAVFNHGAAVATADVNGDGHGDVIVAAGRPVIPGLVSEFRVKVYDGMTLINNPDPTAIAEMSFLQFSGTTLQPRLAAADADGDGKAEVFFGQGPGGLPYVTALSGAGLLAGSAVPVGLFAAPGAGTDGVRMTAHDLPGGTELVFGSGERQRDRVWLAPPSALRTFGRPFFTFQPFPVLMDRGVEVG